MAMPRSLKVIDQRTWYEQGLHFTCSQCGNCCTGGPGYVWISDDEIDRLAAHLRLTREQTLAEYCRRANGKWSLRERPAAGGTWDCIFLRPEKTSSGFVKRACAIYPVRPLQCRTWPFWEGNLAARENWDRAARRCHGMNHGREFTREQIEKLRDATDWPDDSPTS
jgi:Fe-S-cluster containining protein